MTFKRASQLDSTKFTPMKEGTFTTASLFGTELRMYDIQQRALGDCYFLAAMAAFAEFPDRFKKVFLTKTLNNAGLMAMKVFVRGKPTDVVIDDQLPMMKDGTDYNLYFALASKDGAFWGPLAEKVWAKINTNYERIISGNMASVFHSFTGAPS